MLSRTTIERLCKPVVLRRAQRMVDDGERIFRRACRFDEGETTLSARVDSSSSWDEAHHTMVVIDEENDGVTYYECDCRPSYATDSPCDHVAALLLDFLENPDGYEGYDTRDQLITSRGVLRLIEASEAMPLRTSEAASEPGPATVRLEATLSYEAGFDVRFKIVGSRGTYALKSIGEFVEHVENHEFVSYGKSLAFDHTPRSFSLHARTVVDFLVRAIQNRRAFMRERVVARGVRGTTSGIPQREMHLSAPELWELLALYENEGVLFEDRSALPVGDQTAHRMNIVQADPQINVRIESVEGGFELGGGDERRIVTAGQRVLAWDAKTLYCCSETFARNADLLCALFAGSHDPMLVADADAPRFCSSVLRRLDSFVDVTIPERLECLRPRECELRFYLDYDARRSLVTCDARAAYGDDEVPLLGPAQTDALQREPSGPVRDLHAEARGREVLRHYFAMRDGMAYAQVAGEDLGVIVYEGVTALQEVGTVYAYPAFERLRCTARPRVRVGLSVHSRLLDLEMKLEELPQEELASLLASYRSGRSYHQLSDGSVLRMEDADVSQAGLVAEELELEAQQVGMPLQLPAYRALMLDSLMDDDLKDETFRSYLDGLRTVDMGTIAPPASLEGVLRPYQVEGFRWLSGLAMLGLGGVLADEMGLGKSVQLIAFFLAHAADIRKVGPALIVCPSSLVYNWEAECSKFAPELRVRVIAGTPQERATLRGQANADVFVTSYDLLRRDVEDYERLSLWCVALDEAQYNKNPATQSAQAVKRLVAKNRVALTGTPVENRLSELWSIFDFLMPGLLGSYGHFRERFERPIVEDQSDEVAERLRDALRPFILRRTKRIVAADLPDKIEQLVRTHMGSEQRKLYDAQVQEVRNMVTEQGDSFGSGKFQVLALLTRLRQICCDPSLLYEGYDAGSCKTEAILTLVNRVVDAGEKMLVFSQFTSYLDVLAAELDRLGIGYYTIVGSTPSSRRLELVDAFNHDKTPVFLISLKAGGTGLNLTGATVVVHADPWWNEAAQNQATDRAHRIGQTREVTVYKVIASQTIEERIVELQRTKAELADAVVQGDVSSVSLASLTREDLEDLLR